MWQGSCFVVRLVPFVNSSGSTIPDDEPQCRATVMNGCLNELLSSNSENESTNDEADNSYLPGGNDAPSVMLFVFFILCNEIHNMFVH